MFFPDKVYSSKSIIAYVVSLYVYSLLSNSKTTVLKGSFLAFQSLKEGYSLDDDETKVG